MPGTPAPLHRLHPPAESLSALSAIIHSALDLLQRLLYNVQCTRALQCTIYNVQCTYTVSNQPICTLFTLHLIGFTLHCTHNKALSAIIHSTLDLLQRFTIQCTIHYTLCTVQLYNVHCTCKMYRV